MDLIYCLLVGVIILGVMVFSRRSRTAAVNLPPGPRGLPLIGCPWVIFKDMHVAFTEMPMRWGDIFTYTALGQRVVVLNNPEDARAAFSGHSTWKIFSGRPPMTSFNPALKDHMTYLEPNERWMRQRQMVHKILGHFGDGLRKPQTTIQEELCHVVSYLGKKADSVDLRDILYPSLMNIFSILLSGQRHEYGSDVLKNIELIDESTVQGETTQASILFGALPFMAYVPLGPGKYAIQNRNATKQFYRDYYETSKATFDPSVTRGLVDYLLLNQQKLKQEGNDVWLNDESISAIAQEMLSAGSLTTFGALYAFFLIITHKPEIAANIQREVDEIVGLGRAPGFDDRAKMPNTMATILELLRYTSHVPTGLPRKTSEDITFRGYCIPRNTTVFVNSWLIHHDPKLWTDPWEFLPERFLDDDGQLLSADKPERKNLMPFGVGRRSCVGETFAKSRMFLFITTLLQTFTFRADPARFLPPCDPRTYIPGLTLSPHQYFVRLTPRRP